MLKTDRIGRVGGWLTSMLALIALWHGAEAAPIEYKFTATYLRSSSGPAALVNAFGAANQAPVAGEVFVDSETYAISLFTLHFPGIDSFIARAGSLKIGNQPTEDSWIATGTSVVGPHPIGIDPTTHEPIVFDPYELDLKILLPPDYFELTGDVPPSPPNLQAATEGPRFYVRFGGIGPSGQLEGLLNTLVVPAPSPLWLMLAGVTALMTARRRRRGGETASS